MQLSPNPSARDQDRLSRSRSEALCTISDLFSELLVENGECASVIGTIRMNTCMPDDAGRKPGSITSIQPHVIFALVCLPAWIFNLEGCSAPEALGQKSCFSPLLALMEN